MSKNSDSPAAQIFDLSQITPWNHGQFHTLIKGALYKYLMGLSWVEIVEEQEEQKSSYLEKEQIPDGIKEELEVKPSNNNGKPNQKLDPMEIVRKWRFYEWEAIHQGRIVCIIKGNRPMMVGGGQIRSINKKRTTAYNTKSSNSWDIFSGSNSKSNSYLNSYNTTTYYNSYYDYDEIEIDVGDGVVEVFKKGDFAIFDNNVLGLPSIIGVNFFLDFLAQKIEQISYDGELSKKMLLFLTPEKPAEKDWGDMLTAVKIGYMAFMSFQHSGEADSKTGRKGFSLSEVQFQVYQPEGKERDRLRDDFNMMWDLMLWTYGICFDILKNKQERATTSEVGSAIDYFVCREREPKENREDFLRGVEAMFAKRGVKVKYELHFGRHSKDHQAILRNDGEKEIQNLSTERLKTEIKMLKSKLGLKENENN